MANHDFSQDLSDLGVVVLSHNRIEEIRHTLPGLCQATKQLGFELIVVDNASTDGSQELLQKYARKYPEVRLIQSRLNLGVGGGRNLGWKNCSRDYILNLDEDTRINLSHIRSMRDAIEAKPFVGVLFPEMVDHTSGRSLVGHGIKSPGNFHGACHIVRSAAIRSVGYLDPACSFGGEELDYSIRLRAKGWEIEYEPRIVVSHNGLPRSSNVSLWRQTQWHANYQRIVIRYFPIRMALRYSLRLLITHAMSGTSKHGFPFLPPFIRSAVDGYRAGLKYRTPVSRSVSTFYSARDLRPDLGNVPLSLKLADKIRRSKPWKVAGENSG